MAKKQGICKNVDGCSLAADKVIQEAESTQFVCEECGKPLSELSKKSSTKTDQGRSKKPLLLALLAAAIIALGVGAYFLLRDQSVVVENPEPPIPETPIDPKDTDTTAVADTPEVPEVIAVSQVQIAPASITLQESDIADLMVGVFPEDATDKTVVWTSSDESIVVVSNTGHLVAMAAGKAQVQAAVGDVSARCEVTVEPKKEASPKPSYPTVGTFSGTIKEGYPHGTGVLVFTKSRVIDVHDEKERIAEVGDYISGEWDHGHLIQGKWYDSKNQVKGVISIGKAGNPEADRKLGRVKAR